MKIKPLYIYLSIIIIAVVLLIIFTTNQETPNTNIAAQMPQDEIHKGLTKPGMGGGPSGSNVSEEIKKRMEMLKTAYDKNPNDTLKAREYAEFLAAAHKPNDAITVYEKILKKDPKRTDLRFSLALIYFHRQDYAKAEQLISEVFNYDKKNAQARYNLGAIAANKGESDKAKQLWTELVKEQPNTELGKMAQESLTSLGK
ncbi:MAG: tetratricopeptide repeat protein [Ignavibacteriales bacterium]|nr:tetratricopeptide repeat protein [Ignavibacteriales bacterium]